ncbi:hypothetical protein JVU11DRAFT_11350 [Chiua virens]|nr:hypothetical protein JVU11DRAFT_11350 [Chiua virens]
MLTRNRRHLLVLGAVALGQTFLLALAWGLLAAAWILNPLVLPSPISMYIFHNPTETTLVSTVFGTLFSTMSTFFFCTAYKEALRHRIRKPMRLIRLKGRIHIASFGYFFNFYHPGTTLITLILFVPTKLLVSSWSTLITPTIVGERTSFLGSELDLNTTYFESELRNQLLATNGVLPAEDNSLKVIDIDGLLSGINTAQYDLGVRGTLAFNGDVFNVSTGGILPAVSRVLFNISKQAAEANATGLSFVGGSISTQRPPNNHPTTPVNWSILQQGLTADVTCTQINSSSSVNITLETQSPIPVSIFTGNYTSLSAYSYSMPCAQGNPAQTQLVLLQIPATALVYSLVCPYPINQSQLDWTRFTVTSGGTGRYDFLQNTTCEITPKLTTSHVSYGYGTVNVTIINSTALTSANTNLQLFLASIIDFQSRNAQNLLTNSIGDALYTVAMSTNTTLNGSGPMDPRLIGDLEQYWRGVIEFSGTYLRSGFSANPIHIPSQGLISFNGYQTVSTVGWAKKSPIYLYTILPVTFFACLTYAAIGYSVWNILHIGGRVCTDFDPTDPLQLMMASSTRVVDELPGLEGENLGGFDEVGIRNNEDVRVKLKDQRDDKHMYFVIEGHKVKPESQPLVSKANGSERNSEA